MGLGPVFHFERITTARRARYFVMRVIYGLFLLYALAQEYASWSSYAPTVATIKNMAQFAESAFLAFGWGQGLALLFLTPALVAGVIADERQRKTLDYLLASQLSSAEIVLGKLGARLLHVGVLLMVGVPIVCLVALFGGLDPRDVFFIYAGTGSMTLCAASLSILISTFARRPREAIAGAYVLVLTWLILPMMLREIAPNLGWPLEWVKPVNDLVLMTHPAESWMQLTQTVQTQLRWGIPKNSGQNPWLTGMMNEAFRGMLTMVGLQSGLSALFLALAVWKVRRQRRSGGAWSRLRQRIRAIGTRRPEPEPQVPARPAVGDDPMLWKERYATRGGFVWLSSRPVVLFLSVLLGCYLFDTAWPAFADLASRGPNRSMGYQHRMVLNGALRESSAFLFGLALLAVTSAGAVSLTSEREQDTWISLRTTLVTDREIVGGKLIGAIWGCKRLVWALAIMWTVGLLAGAIHPLGVLAAGLALGAYTWFGSALGVYLSLRARNSTRALVSAVAVLLFLNGGYLALFAALRNATSWIAGAGVTPFVVWASLVSYPDVAGLLDPNARSMATDGLGTRGREALVMYGASVGLYGLAALGLTAAAFRRIGKAADRL